jgi:protein phosphatase
LWAGLSGIFRSITKPGKSAATPAPAPGEEDVEVGFEMDGPAAAALAAAGGGDTDTPPEEEPFRLDIGAATSTGRVRKRNEDSFLVQHLSWSNQNLRYEVALIIVADGMGGYEAGDQASGLLIRMVGASLAGVLSSVLSLQIAEPTPAQLTETLEAALKAANRAIHQKGQTDPGCKGMGATVAVLLISNDRVVISHVGDCRVYLYHAGKLNQVTKDQTLVARMVELGQLTPAEALMHPARNEVTQAIGKHADVQPAPYQVQLDFDDWLVVACDGLHAHVDAQALAETIAEAQPSAFALAHQLVTLANEGGGSDNCTVVAVRCY